MSIGYVLMDTKGKVIEKEVIYFPFNEKQLDYDGSEWDTFTFWTVKNKEVYYKHVKESRNIGYEPLKVDGEYKIINPNSKNTKNV